ncbi:hypothetical protein K32_04270 [Kaistia sp. 32K]|uniref:RES family NAD+ phosphorylase n=1 Tax=Kaistia sp. 32K TaxID=2795690 RepID=UPI0019163FB3|nr:RES family NAD+ phosphorylase [Kaistia sp. 32K]BCP51810.1 hypothetical protein K32_04270 [Kaistia sp. 32K]
MTASDFPKTAIEQPTHRLIPSRFPPISAFEDVASADDLAAVLELEGWTNDRLVAERAARLPRAEWVYGRPNASVVMASFLHTPPTGLRFSGGALGAWYGALSVETCIAEVSHHLRREMLRSGADRFVTTYRAYTARIDGAGYVDTRGMAENRPDLYARADYAAPQAFGEAIRAEGGDGILYDSLRHRGGVNVCAYRPSKIQEVTQAGHLELTVRTEGKIVARRLA